MEWPRGWTRPAFAAVPKLHRPQKAGPHIAPASCCNAIVCEPRCPLVRQLGTIGRHHGDRRKLRHQIGKNVHLSGGVGIGGPAGGQCRAMYTTIIEG